MSDISELFDRDPVSLSDQDIAAIVAEQRKSHANFELGVKPPTKAAKPKSTKTADILKVLGLE